MVSGSSDVFYGEPCEFEVLGYIGRGGFSNVLKVRKVGDPDSKRAMAMKIVDKKHVVDNYKSINNLNNERSVLSSIPPHEFIVGLFYSFQTETSIFFVMEFVPGDLFDLLDKFHKLDLEEVKFIISEIILALQHLHDLFIIYRDLKPENIMFDVMGHVKLIDLGMCKTDIKSGTKTYTFCGTLDYMSPEIIAKTGYGLPADLWALGATAYDMAFGIAPFYSYYIHVTKDKILHSDVIFPDYLSDDNFRDLILKLMNKNPNNRLSMVEVRSHPFFKSINWNDVIDRKLTPRDFKSPKNQEKLIPRNKKTMITFFRENKTDKNFKDFDFFREREFY